MKLYYLFLLILMFSISCSKPDNTKLVKKSSDQLKDGLYADLDTQKGKILIELEFKNAPLSVTNFVGLAEGTIKNKHKNRGIPFYDGVSFHRIVDNFVIQTGDPQGDGEGGPGYSFPIELTPELKHDVAGTVGMARDTNPDSNGSQFYITHRATPHLDESYIVFGKVIKGLKTVNKIKKGDILKAVKIIRIGKTAQEFKADDPKFAILKEIQLNKNRIRIQQNKLYVKKRTEQILTILKESKMNKTTSGLEYIIIKNGNGRKIKEDKTHKAQFIGFTKDKKTIRSSYLKGVPYLFRLKSETLNKGLKESFQDMTLGEKRIVIIPPHLNIDQTKTKKDRIKTNMIYELELIL